jgi:hypothetical protein
MNGWKMIYHRNGTKNQTGVAILKSDKTDSAKINQKSQRRSRHSNCKSNPSI